MNVIASLNMYMYTYICIYTYIHVLFQNGHSEMTNDMEIRQNSIPIGFMFRAYVTRVVKYILIYAYTHIYIYIYTYVCIYKDLLTRGKIRVK